VVQCSLCYNRREGKLHYTLRVSVCPNNELNNNAFSKPLLCNYGSVQQALRNSVCCHTWIRFFSYLLIEDNEICRTDFLGCIRKLSVHTLCLWWYL
jgi:hypothetical protein